MSDNYVKSAKTSELELVFEIAIPPQFTGDEWDSVMWEIYRDLDKTYDDIRMGLSVMWIRVFVVDHDADVYLASISRLINRHVRKALKLKESVQ